MKNAFLRFRIFTTAGSTVFLSLLFNLTLLAPSPAAAQASYAVTSTGGGEAAGTLGWAITEVNANGGGTIDLTTLPAGSAINLTASLPWLTQGVTILGGGVTVNGENSYSILNFQSGSASIANLQLVNGTAKGGNGASDGTGAGGGLGAGGAIFVRSGVTLMVNNVNFNGNNATGGNGGTGNDTTAPGGGGAMNGANGSNGYDGGFGCCGGAGGGPNGGVGGQQFVNGGAGGNGGYGSGGGGGYVSPGGNGGFGGGGGAAGTPNGSIGTGFVGGNGGFGGGGGGVASTGCCLTPGSGGAYAGNGGQASYNGAGGGGGAGLGGGLFVDSGAIVNFIGNSLFSSDTVQGGSGGGGGAGNGQGLGQDIFLYGSAVTFASGASSLSDSIAGTGGLVVNGTASVTLGAANSYSGGTALGTGGLVNANNNGNFGSGTVTFDGGTLQAGTNGLTVGNNGSITSNNGIVDTNGNNLTLSGVIGGTGALIKDGSGTLYLTGTNTYSGGTTINAGTLNIKNDSSWGTGNVAANGATIQTSGTVTTSKAIVLTGSDGFDTNGFNSTLSGTISGSGALTKIGSGKLTLTGTNTYGGGTTVNAGTLNINSDSAWGTGDVVLNGATLQTAAGVTSSKGISLAGSDTWDTNGFNSTLNGTLSGTGSLTKISAGTLTLTGTNTYSGGTTVNGGTLNINSDSAWGTGNVALNGGTLQTAAGITSSKGISLSGSDTFDSNGFDSTMNGVLNGAGSLTKIGTGTLTLTGTNTYSGGTTLTAGTISVGNDDNLGTGNLVFNGGTLQASAGITSSKNISLTSNSGTFDTQGFDSTLSGAITGTGSLSKIGSGILTLSGNNSYSGNTDVMNGTLAMGSATALSANTVASLSSGATLDLRSYNETIGNLTGSGTVTLGSGTLTEGNSNNSTFSGVIDGPGSLTKQGTGILILSGNNTYTGGTAVNGGVLQLGIANALASTGSLSVGSGALFNLNSFNQTIGDLTGSGTVTLGSGTLTAGTATSNTTFSGVISGSGSFTKQGSGTLILSGSNTYMGGTDITAGILQLGKGNALATTGSVDVASGASLNLANFNQTVGDLTGGGNIVLGTGNLTAGTATSNTTFSGVISGSGSFTKQGSGTLILSGSNTYTGGTDITSGILQLGASNALTTTGAVSVASSATFNLNNLSQTIGDLTGSGTVALGSGTLTEGTSNNTTFSGVIGGTGSFIKQGAGILTLSGVNDFGALAINAGGISMTTNNQTITDLSGAGNLVVTGVTLTEGSTNNTTFSGNLTGTGSLVKQGTGTLTLSGTNNFGALAINGGTVDMTSNQTVGSLIGSATLALDSALTEGNSSNNTFSGGITGTGSLTKTGTGTLTLSDANTYSGGTTFTAGIVSVSNDDNLGTGNLTFNGGTLQTSAAVTSSKNISVTSSNGTFDTQSFNSTLSGVISGTGAFNKAGSGILTLTGAGTLTGQTNVNAGTLALGSGGSLSSSTVDLSSGTVLDVSANNATGSIGGLTGSGGVTLGSDAFSVGGNNASTTFSGAVSGTGSLTKTGTGSLTLSGTSVYSGGTTLTGGTVSVGNDNNLGTGQLTFNGGTLTTTTGITSSKTVVFTSNDGTFNTNGVNSTLSGTVSGAGALTKSGTGTLTLTGTNTYSGGTSVTGGTLNVNSEAAMGATTGLLALSGSTLQTGAGITSVRNLSLTGNDTLDTETFDSSFAGAVTGTGSLTKIGSGALTLTGTNTYSGGTSINGGLLSVGSDSNWGTGNLEFNNSTLQLSGTILTGKNVSLGASGVSIDTNGNVLCLGGTVSGTGLNKVGSGALTLLGNNTYSGGTTLTAGIIDVDADNNLGTGHLVFNGGTLQTTSGITSAKAVSLAGNGTFDSDGSNSTLSGVISGAGEFTKAGAGSLTLTGANIYTGLTDVNNGSLVLGTTGTLLTTAAITVESAGTLDLGNNNQTLGHVSGSGIIALGSGNLTLGDSTSQLFSGVISGSGALIKTGGGTLTLTGVNTYSGGTEVSNSILNVSNDNNLGTGELVLDGGTLQTAVGITSAKTIGLTSNNGIFDTQSFNSTLTGNIVGAGNLDKVGTGTLTLDGNSTYTGGTSVSAGSLIVGDSSNVGANLYGPVNVSSNGFLGGYGSILGTVINNGTLKAGGSSGVLSIAQLDDTSSSTLQVELGPGNGQSGLLNVFNAQLNGAVSVTADNGNYGIRYKYVILDTGAPITGTFSSVTDNLSYMTPTLAYGADSVTLTLTRNNVDFTANAATSNETAMGQVLNASVATASDDFVAVLNQLYLLPASQQKTALGEMTGSSYAPMASVMVNNNASSTDLLMQRAGGTAFVTPSSFQSMMVGRTAFDLTDSAPSLSEGLKEAQNTGETSGLWVESSSGSLSEDGNANVVGYTAQNTGFLGGYDVMLAKGLRGGLWGSYTHMDLTSTDGADSTGVDNYLVGLYGGPTLGNITLTGVVAYGIDHYKATRTIVVGASSQAQAAYDGSELMGALRASYAMKISGVSVDPQVGLQYTRLNEDGFTETGAGALDLNVAAQQYQSLRPMVGFDASKAFNMGGGMQLVPMVGAQASQELMALNPTVSASLAGDSGSSFTVTGLTPDATLFGVSAGAKLSFGQGLNLFAQYLGSFGGSQTANAFDGGVDFSL